MLKIKERNSSDKKEIRLSEWFVVILLYIFLLILQTQTDLFFSSSLTGILLPGILLVAALFDIKYGLIPNNLVSVGIVIWMFLVIIGRSDLVEPLPAAVLAAAVVLLIRRLGKLLFNREGMGMGDAKLIFVMGLYLGWNVFWMIYLAVLLGGIWSGGGLALRKLDRTSRLPFAPFLLAGTCLGLFFLPYETVISLWM